MTEEEPTFDPTMKKKKKKKKITDFEEEEDAEAQEAEAPAAEEAKEPTEENMEEDFSMLKKKKKKKKPIDLGELEDALPKEEEEDINPDEGEPLPGEEDDLDFSLSTKKKKKKKVKIVDGDTEMTEKEEKSENVTSLASSAWQDSDRDYTYDELLNRVFDIMREKNPDLVAGEKKRFVMKPPQVMRVGTKKTSFSNFAEICRMLRRQHKHVLAFLLAELGTSGSIDGNNQLIMKGRFQQKHLESVLRRYIKEYVTCHTCRSPDTNLQKDTRLYFLQCETCGSRCSVASIKAGFKAVTGKRAAIRAKTA